MYFCKKNLLNIFDKDIKTGERIKLMSTNKNYEVRNLGVFNPKAKNISKLLKDVVMTPFQEALKTNTGFSKDNLPQKTEIDIVELGDYIFNVTSERKEKRPQLPNSYENWSQCFCVWQAI